MLEPGVRFCPKDGTPLTQTSALSTVPTTTGSRPKSVDITLPVVVGGRYRLEEKRGGGGMAKVYRAFDTTMDRTVAVKLINQELRSEPEFDARFEREAKIASQLNDPHIVVVHDYGIDVEFGPFLVMEYLEGESLRERLNTGGRLPFKAGLQLGAQLMLALIHAHDKGIVHRDIKPDNVFLLNQSGVRLHLRVLDFGIARIYKRDAPGKAEAITHVGAVLGTPRYMSPEQLAGQPVDARTDLYSAALVIYESLTGDLPFVGGKSLCELCPEATPALQAFLHQCLNPTPADRPASALVAYLRLQEMGRASGILLLPPGALETLARSRKSGGGDLTPHSMPTQAIATVPTRASWLASRATRRVLLAAVASGVLAAGALLAMPFLFPKPPPTTPPPVESLLGVKIGDPRQDVVEKLNLLRNSLEKNPWEKDPPPDYIGHVLRPRYLGLPEEEFDRLVASRTTDEKVCALFRDDKLAALTVHAPHPGNAANGVGVGNSESDLAEHYRGEYYQNVPLPAHAGRPAGEVRHYLRRGVSFAIHNGRVTAVALYPPVREEE
jgi:serine/threonine protein kinase